MKTHSAFSQLLLLALVSCSMAAAQTSLSSLTSNNTSACPSGGPLPAQCQLTYSGQTDTIDSPVATQEYDRPASNVSDEDIHAYLAGGSGTKVFTNFMLGFCTNNISYNGNVAYCNNNVVPGYTANDINTVSAQVEDLRRRHIDGAVMTWEGDGTGEDQATIKYQWYVNQNHCSGPQNCDPMYLIMVDGPSVSYDVTSTGISGTSGAGCSTSLDPTSYENCVIAHIRNDMCYMNGYHWGNDAYQKWNGRPVVQVFPYESGTPIPAAGPAPSWTDVWYWIGQWNSNLPSNCQTGPYNGDNGVPLLIFENVGGFTHESSNGSYYWIEPEYWNSGGSNQFVYNITPDPNFPGASEQYFYQQAANYGQSGDMVWGAGFKGFNDVESQWGGDLGQNTSRVMDQDCAQTWLKSLTEGNSDYSNLGWIEIDTFNDYNEGTEIESGIDNCYTSSGSVNGQTLNWSLNPTNSSLASLSTVSHVEIYDTTDGGQTMNLLASVPTAASGSYDLSGLPSGSYQLYVRMVGKNSILNQISSPIAFSH